jgi:RNA polymerase sigma-70 factor (ECF subfamily)
MRDEIRVIRLAKEGDREAFAGLADRYRRMLYAAAYSVLRSPDEAEDVAQEALCRIFAKMHTLREGSSFGRWAYAIAKNTAIARLRSRSREVPFQDMSEHPASEISETISDIREAVEGLPDRLREPVLMYYINGYSGKEVANFLGIPHGTVRARLTEARRALRKELVPMLKRTLQELMPPGELSGLLGRLQAFPKTMPDLSIVEVDAPLPDPDYLEPHWFFTPLRPSGTVVTGWYDYPERGLSDYGFGRVLGEVEMNGRKCYELVGAGSPSDEPETYRLFYWSILPEEVYLAAIYRSEEDRLRFPTDADWTWSELPPSWPRHPGRANLLRRIADEEFVDEEKRSLAPVGVYDVTIGGKTQRCLRVIDPPDRGALAEAYVNADGRTVLWRRYNGAPEWSGSRVRGPHQTPGAVERLRELGNHRLVYNGLEFYHWYDCVTDVALGEKAVGDGG